MSLFSIEEDKYDVRPIVVAVFCCYYYYFHINTQPVFIVFIFTLLLFILLLFYSCLTVES